MSARNWNLIEGENGVIVNVKTGKPYDISKDP